jgi:hypothetical protein
MNRAPARGLRVPRFSRATEGTLRHAPWSEPESELEPVGVKDLTPTLPETLRLRAAFLVMARVATPGRRVALVLDDNRPALVSCHEQLFDVLAKDHPIVGVYTFGATVQDVMDDLKACGL